MLQIYGLKNCDSCKRARKWLAAHEVDYRFVDIRDQPPTRNMFERWLQEIGPDRLINRRSTSWRGLTDSERTLTGTTGVVNLLSAKPELIKRPLIVDGNYLDVGFDEAVFEERYG